jgi:SAM-dependent methyltransferase
MIINDPKDRTKLEPRWPENGLESVPTCPVCGETRREVLYEGLTDRVFFCAPGEWTLFHCLGCRSGYLDPRPSPDTIALAYQRYYTHESAGKEAFMKPKRGIAGLRSCLRYGYLNHRYNLTLKPASPLGRWIVPLFPVQRRGIDRWMRHMTVPYPGARLLDVGCGNGDHLRLASRIGWEAQGLEPDPTAAAAARSAGLHVQEGHLPETGLPSDYFEAVTLSHAIEHLHDPVRSLQEVYRILAPGGKLWIATPNLESPLHRRFRCNWLPLDPPRHLVLFNLPSLVSICRRNGFELVTVYNQPGSAEATTAKSRSITHSEDPFGETPFKLDLADRFRAFGLDLAAVLRPEWGEELVVIATKPS